MWLSQVQVGKYCWGGVILTKKGGKKVQGTETTIGALRWGRATRPQEWPACSTKERFICDVWNAFPRGKPEVKKKATYEYCCREKLTLQLLKYFVQLCGRGFNPRVLCKENASEPSKGLCSEILGEQNALVGRNANVPSGAERHAGRWDFGGHRWAWSDKYYVFTLVVYKSEKYIYDMWQYKFCIKNSRLTESVNFSKLLCNPIKKVISVCNSWFDESKKKWARGRKRNRGEKPRLCVQCIPSAYTVCIPIQAVGMGHSELQWTYVEGKKICYF